MTDQNTFMEVVQNVAEIVRTAEVPMTEEEILAYFSDMDLNENQKKLVLEYIVSSESQQEDIAQEQEDEQNATTEDEEDAPKSKVFQMYLEELAMLPSFTAAERNKLYAQLALGDADVIGTISTAWLKKVLMIAEKYMDPRLNVEDLVQEGNMALFMKLQELLGVTQDNIEEVLSSAVEEGIMSYCSEMVGEQELEHTLVGKISLVHEAKKMLAMEKGQEPTVEELSEYTKMTKEELLEMEEFLKDNQ